MEVFIAGIMQGSRDDDRIVDQQYRTILTQALEQHVHNAIVTDPLSLDPNSVSYNLEQAKDACQCKEGDLGEQELLCGRV